MKFEQFTTSRNKQFNKKMKQTKAEYVNEISQKVSRASSYSPQSLVCFVFLVHIVRGFEFP